MEKIVSSVLNWFVNLEVILKKAARFIFLALLVALVGYGVYNDYTTASAPSHSNDMLPLSLVERMAVLDDWKRAAMYIVEDSDDIELIILHMTLNRAGISLHIGQNYPDFQIVQERSLRGSVVLVPILQEDIEGKGAWSAYLRENAGSYIWTQENDHNFIIFLGANAPFSDIWKGVLFLYACTEAWIHGQLLERGDEERDYVGEEIIALEKVLHPTLLRIGGPMYAQVLEDAKKEFVVMEGAWDHKLEKYEFSLDMIFGVPVSESEASLRTMMFFTQVLFEHFRENYPEEFSSYAVRRVYESLLTK